MPTLPRGASAAFRSRRSPTTLSPRCRTRSICRGTSTDSIRLCVPAPALRARMAIDDQISVGTVFVLADFALDERRFRELGKTFGEKVARALDAGCTRRAIAVRRIEDDAARVVRDFESAAVDVGNAVDDPFPE